MSIGVGHILHAIPQVNQCPVLIRWILKSSPGDFDLVEMIKNCGGCRCHQEPPCTESVICERDGDSDDEHLFLNFTASTLLALRLNTCVDLLISV